MSIKIGNKNKIKNTTIGHNTEKENKKSFSILSTIIIPILIGIVLMFSFWESVVIWIENFIF